ncbi:hypothetical protein SDJN03_22475, partial [Cucurbita argyrosperma subsp. sororia]
MEGKMTKAKPVPFVFSPLLFCFLFPPPNFRRAFFSVFPWKIHLYFRVKEFNLFVVLESILCEIIYAHIDFLYLLL